MRKNKPTLEDFIGLGGPKRGGRQELPWGKRGQEETRIVGHTGKSVKSERSRKRKAKWCRDESPLVSNKHCTPEGRGG